MERQLARWKKLYYLRVVNWLWSRVRYPIYLRIICLFSEIVPVGEVGDVEELESILGYRVSLLPMKYMGLPLGASYEAISIWNDIIKKNGTSVG